MEAGFVALAVIVLVVGIVVGVYIEKSMAKRRHSQGILNIDCSDPVDGPYMFLELKVPVSDVVNRKRVVLDVAVKNAIFRTNNSCYYGTESSKTERRRFK